MPRIRKAPVGTIVQVSAVTWNQVATAANQWLNLVVRHTDHADAVTKLVRAEGRTELIIASPLASGGGGSLPDGSVVEEWTICVDGAPESRWVPVWLADPEA